jgi:lipopolysaccharide/colanic/teichoic acid biosynthesis glycosyltransferase
LSVVDKNDWQNAGQRKGDRKHPVAVKSSDTTEIPAAAGKTAEASRSTPIGGSSVYWASKRIFDIGLSIFAMPAVVFVGFVLVLVNPFFNPGPLLYSQPRIGLRGRPFWIVKFRTMESRPGHQPTAPTRALGRILRKYRVDELPQIVNVLRGQMSLIGPRPEMVGHVEKYGRLIPGFDLRHSVRPGISGLSQVMIGYTSTTLSYTQKLEYDMQYIQGAGWRMDARVFLLTIGVVVTGYGAR